MSSNNIIGFAGAFKDTQWRAILETVLNLVVSFVCVFKFGIYGVLMGTIVAVFYRANDIIIFANRKILKRSAWPTYRRWFTNTILFIIIVAFFTKMSLNVNTIVGLIINGKWVSIIILIMFFVVTSVIEKESRRIAKSYLDNIINSVIKKN